MEKKAFFIIFKGASLKYIKVNVLEGESPTLKTCQILHLLKFDTIFVVILFYILVD